MAIYRAGSASPVHQPSRVEETALSPVPSTSTLAARGSVAAPLAGLVPRHSRNRLSEMAEETVKNIAKHARPADRIALAQTDRKIRGTLAHDARAAIITTIDAPRVTTLAGFNALRAEIQELPMRSLREEPLAALGAHILQLPRHQQQEAIDGFLADAQGDVGPRSNFLEVLILGAGDGPTGLRASIQTWRTNPGWAVMYGPGTAAALTAMRPGGSGELWNSVAKRMGITHPLWLNALQRNVAQGPATEAILTAMWPGGSGELWHEVAKRMGITSSIFQHALQRSVAKGPAAVAVLSAMAPGGSGELWHQVAKRMGITRPDLLSYLARLRPGDFTRAYIVSETYLYP